MYHAEPYNRAVSETEIIEAFNLGLCIILWEKGLTAEVGRAKLHIARDAADVLEVREQWKNMPGHSNRRIEVPVDINRCLLAAEGILDETHDIKMGL